MWLSDYEQAIKDMYKAFGNSCWKSITTTVNGDFIFETTQEDCDYYYLCYRKTGKIVKIFNDTWKDKTHWELIQETR